MYSIVKTLSVFLLAAGAVVAAPTPVQDGALEARWGGHWKGRPVSQPATPVATEAAASVPTTDSTAPVATLDSSSNTGYMAIVSKWRSAGGLPALTQDSKLEANALKTSTDSVGGLKHELNPGTMAQVLAPGDANNFENVYVGGWLCEIPSLPGLNGICATAAKGWAADGQTGHAEILTSKSYSKIGCALSSSTGVWACDLA